MRAISIKQVGPAVSSNHGASSVARQARRPLGVRSQKAGPAGWPASRFPRTARESDVPVTTLGDTPVRRYGGGGLVAPAHAGCSRTREERSDEQLVALAQKGDPRAFELLVRKYQYKIIQLVGRLVGDADSGDVAQETFIKAYRALNGFRGQSQFYTWLYRIGINTAKNHLVSRGRRPAAYDVDVQDAEQYGHTEHLSDYNTPEAHALTEEIKHKVADSMAELPRDLRQAITLRELEGLSYEEIAEIMVCPIGTVRSRIFRAREAIDAAIQPLVN